eukprot:CAMPEP_0168415264 /NCGR_PEP_ID=MMETSP0228-20121227/30146_1 /TAXON_ID=133427 /ORGANISM="Protoceratium reticulatum, Strain CCCM 535 (=CCMP 1889)" /LENGTH=80 /DNA_ID=CAMNT_0008429075 /DNA_START=35 /DNA_END=274 /DNA_ORIENTATION=-
MESIFWSFTSRPSLVTGTHSFSSLPLPLPFLPFLPLPLPLPSKPFPASALPLPKPPSPMTADLLLSGAALALVPKWLEPK